ncbi:MAG TPA: hypothetical protein VKT77_12065, partial [Chthonomonadaceae bacterium]|nr:hypothetical protein [Chthonomonadaceae bacterium]
MNVELTRVLVEARTLAQERGWSRTADAADAALASAPANALLLVSPPDVDFGGLPRWIKETAPQLEIAKTGTEALAANPLAAGEAERVVAVFECGKLMTADAVEIVQRVCFSRPDGSYAIILRGAESLENPEEREILERGVFRLLVPDPKGEWFGQDLLHRGCYLWCDGSAPAFLAEKIERDRAALGDWLRRPARHGDALAIQQALEMLDLADRELDGSPKSAAEEPLLTPTRLFIAVNDMSELRRRLTARVDAEAPSIERQLGASLQTLEQDLLQGARAYVLPRLPQFDPSRDQSRLTAVVTEYIAAAAREWKARAEQILGTRSHELQSDLDTVLHGLDWRVANAACESVGEPGGYPDALLENLAPAQG